MIDHFFYLALDHRRGLQEQLREALVSAILARSFPADEPLPSCRKLSQQLDVSRNTVALVYEGLLDDGYLVSRPRSGYYLHPDYHHPAPDHVPESCRMPENGVLRRINPTGTNTAGPDAAEMGTGEIDRPDWNRRFRMEPGLHHGVLRPGNWPQFTYPFVYGQPDTKLFPLDHWREVSRFIMKTKGNHVWMRDGFDRDDDMLIEQLRTRVLPKRGIWAKPDEILVTLGSQNALFLLAHLLMGKGVKVAMENPGFRDAWNVFDLLGVDIHLQDVDAQGMIIDAQNIITNRHLAACDYLYVTPGHQVPTGCSMSPARRRKLMRHVKKHDQIVIEDDYDAELNLDNHPQPTLKAGDDNGRVIYISSLSKVFSPGLRLGYLVADAELVNELRALRRLMYRHPPLNNQRMLAQFLAQGYYDAHLRRFRSEHCRRRETLQQALDTCLDSCESVGDAGASAFWLTAPEGIDTRTLAWAAAKESVLIESGSQFFFDDAPSERFFRLGFHAIGIERIKPGIEILAKVLSRQGGASPQREEGRRVA